MNRFALLAFALLLGACDYRPVPAPISASRKALALKTIDQQREIFNSGDCAFVYDGSPNPNGISPAWSKQCGELYARLGVWRSFRLSSLCNGGATFSCLQGSAEFTRGTANVEMWVGFKASDRAAWVQFLTIARDKQRWVFPPPQPARVLPPPRSFPAMRLIARPGA